MSSTVGEAFISVSADDKGLSEDIKAAAEKAAKKAKAKVQFESALRDEREIAAKARVAAEKASASAKVEFSSDADFGDLIVQAKAAARAAKSRVEVEMVLNKKGFVRDSEGVFRNFAGEAANAQDIVSELGDSMQGAAGGGGFLSKAFDAIAGSAGRSGAGLAAIVVIVEALLPYLVAVGGGIIALAGQLAYASAQAIPLATNLGALALGAVATVVATRGLGDSFKALGKQQEAANASNVKTKEGQEALKKATDEYKASLDNLPKSAQQFVTSISSLSGAFTGLRRDVQDSFFKGLGDQIKETSDRLLPTLRKGLVGTAGVINDGANALLKWAGSKEGVKQIATIFSGLNGILRPLMSGIGGFAKGFLTIFTGALGPGKEMAQTISDIGDRFSEWAGKFVKGGGLTDLLDKAKEAGGKLLDILGNVGGILGDLFAGSSDLGGDLLQSLADITQGFKDMLDSADGKQKMGDFFAAAGRDLSGIADALRVGVPAFVTFVQQLQKGSDVFNEFADAIQPIAKPLGVILGLLATPPIVTGIQALIAPFQLLSGIDWGAISSGIGGFFSSIGGASGSIDLGGMFSGLIDSAKGLGAKIFAGAGDLLSDFTTWASGLPAAAGALVDEVVGYFSGLADRAVSSAGDIASSFGTWLAGLPVAAINAVTDFLVNFADLAGRAVTAAGDILGAFTQWLANLPTAAVYGIATLIGTFAGLAYRLFVSAGDAAAAFGTWVAGLPGRAAQLVGEIGGALAGLAGRMIAGAGNLASAFGSWVSGLPSRAAALAGQISGALSGLAGRMIAGAGSLASAFGSWVSGLPGAARSAAARIASGFSGLSGRMISAAGSLVAKVTSWASGVAGAARAAADRLVSAFRGLAGRIVSAIGTIVPQIGMPNISGIIGRIRSAAQAAAKPHAKGGIVSSPTFAMLGEAGPEVVVPLSRGNVLDPSLIPLLKSVASDRGIKGDGSTGGGGDTHNWQVMLPTGDPQAAAKAMMDRLSLVTAA